MVGKKKRAQYLNPVQCNFGSYMTVICSSCLALVFLITLGDSVKMKIVVDVASS